MLGLGLVVLSVFLKFVGFVWVLCLLLIKLGLRISDFVFGLVSWVL